ncbi:dihydroorotate dehydrogenase-like protein [Synechococcus sp. CS-602]|uniref:dihydroorotate dehydrogenase-like protein n=1 Tax=Synechococcaceae TaxID=1890426 RepID=UPI0008FF4B3A|nr:MULTISPECIES: dihydroorotate dehydrogenase-like protein [Synechococcaceae]MCT4364369.1 dihydroorotate dehydrogenase-like protein [Candidatus Regnicoccus frigidus MAG-AL1]APD48842.1 dihydroorotate dehydrogenase [Synechococcus sp. SynAce01]MCT0202423.1 dihydroorotate dehydrogenase-like protein [Synechococcus sp. CS-603]MCT0205048.1 dihydroorotate dehydrogenase-like protein [Synechococcus sp. CS-602]MCT0246503.1 dihydroorotate dehydrogenase-like protein [Synechococcus sp. CS-601]
MNGPDLATTYLGLPLSSPLVVGAAAPLSADPDLIPRLAEQGAAAVVLHSLFLEQIEHDWQEWEHHQQHGSESFAESLSFVPPNAPTHLGIAGYLQEIESARRRVDIPIIASLNGNAGGHWAGTVRAIEQAGAQAIELNLYAVPTDAERSGGELEEEQLAIVSTVCTATRLPVAVKLSPSYTNLAHFARRLHQAGARGLVLFNRFFQPDIDIEALEHVSNVLLSSAADLRPPLRWIALLEGQVPLDFAASGGVAHGTDVVRLLMVGASVTMVVSDLLRHGPGQLRQLETELTGWLEQHNYASVQDLRGCMSQRRCPDPAAFERAQYVRAISTSPAGSALGTHL